MPFLASLLAAFLLFSGGARLYERRALPGPLDSLRAGRLHYVVLGIMLGVCFPDSPRLLGLFEGIRGSLLAVLVVWIGYQTGLDLNLRNLRRHSSRRLLGESLQTLLILLFGFVALLASAPLLRADAGVAQQAVLVALLLAAMMATVRIPEFLFHFGRRPFVAPSGLSTYGSPLALLLFGLAMPAAGGISVLQVGSFPAVGYAGVLLILAALGVLLGIALDFIFRGHRASHACIFLSISTMAAVGSTCVYLRLPGLFVGTLAGAWLTNTTVRRREVLELTERAGAVAEPAFFLLAGTLAGRSAHLEATPILLFGLAFLLARGLLRMLGMFGASRILKQRQSPYEILARGWRPMGTLAVALAVQGLYLPVPTGSDSLFCGLLLAVYLSQILPTPAPGEAAPATAPARPASRAPQKQATA